MRPPRFWFNPPQAPGWQARLLAPLGAVYGLATRWRMRRPGWRAERPVWCIGNLNAGGTGKTPLTIALIQHLGDAGVAAQVVTRGYGGRLAGPVRVDPRRHDAAQVGDEALLMAAFAPVWVARDRAAGVRAAQDAGADLVLMDDGLQNPAVNPHRAVIVVDAQTGFGNARCLPAGPLREPVAQGLARADLVLAIGTPAERDAFAAAWGGVIGAASGRAGGGVPLLGAQVEPLATGMDWRGLRVLAFAGIGRPQKFFTSLAEQGAEILRAQALSDHQPLGAVLFSRLEREAQALGAQLVTTEKDAVRLPQALRQRVLTLPVRLRLEEPARILALLGLPEKPGGR